MNSKDALDNLVGIQLLDYNELFLDIYQEEFDVIKKDLERLEKLEKALKIIINKNLNAKLFVECLENHKEKYKKEMSFKEIGFRLCFASNLTKKEFELLKGVLCNA